MLTPIYFIVSATVYNFVGIWVERRKQQILKELNIKEGQEIPEDVIVTELRKAVEHEFKIDYLVTGSWSLKASQEAARLIGPEYVNIAADGRQINDGKFGKIPEEKDWKLSKNPAMVYYCDNETVDVSQVNLNTMAFAEYSVGRRVSRLPVCFRGKC